jgi:hypothetical protein
MTEKGGRRREDGENEDGEWKREDGKGRKEDFRIPVSVFWSPLKKCINKIN